MDIETEQKLRAILESFERQVAVYAVEEAKAAQDGAGFGKWQWRAASQALQFAAEAIRIRFPALRKPA